MVLTSCIGTDILDDAVDPEVVILNPVTSIEIGTTYAFMAEYRNMVGMPEDVPLTWESDDPGVISIDNDGNATALTEGETRIRVSTDNVETFLLVEAGAMTSGPLTERVAQLQTSSSYPLSGTARLLKTSDGLILRFDEDFQTTSALPGLYVYLSNNTSTTNNAYEVAKVSAFRGAQEYIISDLEDLSSYKYVLFFCKPFVVPVGDGELKP